MARCRACNGEITDKAKFCPECGAPQAVSTPDAGEERKVVSVLFCDLVGFTAQSDAADPEDVRLALAPYHQLMRTEIQRYGGTVEKFIGDAVMAVFGAPVAHEDDAERAVRAGLRLLDAIVELNNERNLDLAVRVGVNTGEAVVAIGARPERGEGIVTGDVVNTAARLQTAAPVGGLVVGEGTWRQTRDHIDYEELSPVSVKGKAAALTLWRAHKARSRFGSDLTVSSTPFVGREFELIALRNTFARAVRELSTQLVTIVGEPGVGKSRLVGEFFAWFDTRDELVTWRQGRCLPYGDGITFWALAEIVKAQAGLLETDHAEEARAKVAAAVGSLVDAPQDRAWMVRSLAALVGLSEDATPARDELFTACRRFLEGIAAESPMVLVVEDVHWADPAMLEFLEHLVDWSTGVPLLVVTTARPELFDRAPGWAGGKRNAATLALAALDDAEVARLLSGLLGTSLLPADVQSVLLERAGGNPLYAQEFVRMLLDRGVLDPRGRALQADPAATAGLPDSVQALIAARLDTLPAGHKRLLLAAAVLGKVFWSGAAAALAGLDEAVARNMLHELDRRELVRRARVSSVAGQEEYNFTHGLIRDVAYAQLPRQARIARHVAAADWIESLTHGGGSDQTEIIVSGGRCRCSRPSRPGRSSWSPTALLPCTPPASVGQQKP